MVQAETCREILREKFQCESVLLPVPIGIATMVDLIVMASTLGDFSLEEHQPTDGWKLVQHPKSFQASLRQISFAAHRAFLKAHVSMDTILRLAKNIPGHVNDIQEILNSEELKSSCS